VAKGLAVITGVAVFTLTFLTDHELGVIRVFPFSFRLAADFIVGVVFVISPFARGEQAWPGGMTAGGWASSHPLPTG